MISLTLRLQRAINECARLHKDQWRKGDELPYVVHPFSVAWILASVTDDEDVVIAGLLHDALEDVDGYEYEHLEEAFGPRVASLVSDVTENAVIHGLSKTETWLHRKEAYLSHLQSAPNEAVLISLADKMHNAESMICAYELHGEDLWKSFHAPTEKRLWLFEEVMSIGKDRFGHHPIVARLQKAVDDLRSVIRV